MSSLFNRQEKIFAINDNYLLLDTPFYLCRGGWPLSIQPDREKALKITANYCSTLFEFKNSKNRKFRNKKPELFRMILRSYARNISTEARRKTIIDDIYNHEDQKFDAETVDNYLKGLNDLFFIKDIEAWNPKLRSKTGVTSSPTRHFIDTSIATNALNIDSEDLLNNHNSFGLFFEDFAVKDLSIYAKSIKGEIRHFRDANGLECDAVIHPENGNYAPIEIKLGGEDQIKKGISTLKALQSKLLSSEKKQPSFLMGLTAVGSARTIDNVHIVPINVLNA